MKPEVSCKEEVLIDDSDSDDDVFLPSLSRRKVKNMPGDGHCIIHCFAEHFSVPVNKIIKILEIEFKDNLQLYMKFTDLSKDDLVSELHKYLVDKTYNTGTVDLVLEALSKIFECNLVIRQDSTENSIIGQHFDKKIYLKRSKHMQHYDLIIDPGLINIRYTFFVY